MMAALAALLVPAGQAEAAKKKKVVAKPVVTKVAPTNAAIGDTLTVYGRNFIVGKGRNSVAFKRDGSPAVFVKSDVSTRRQIKVILPAKLSKYLIVRDGAPGPTPFRVRVLAKRFGKSFTSLAKSPIIGPERTPAEKVADQAAVAASPDGDCDGDGVLNGAETDKDDDLLPDALENQIKTDQCKNDSDADGIEDGFEYRSAVDLNDDEYQQPNTALPYPASRPYPNPLFADAERDFDGDGLPLSAEFELWVYSWKTVNTATRTLDKPSYSDGVQYSIYVNCPSSGAAPAECGTTGANANRRVPTLEADTYERVFGPAGFITWAQSNGYGKVMLTDDTPWFEHRVRNEYDLLDVDRSTTVEAWESTLVVADANGHLSDDQRDEDADGLSNIEELRGAMRPEFWKSCYAKEPQFLGIEFSATNYANADSDGDGIRDGADDEDRDDVPNLMELSRWRASGIDDSDDRIKDVFSGNGGRPCQLDPDQDLELPNHPDAFGWVHVFNPCLPDRDSRSCPRNVTFGQLPAPFAEGTPTWLSLH